MSPINLNKMQALIIVQLYHHFTINSWHCSEQLVTKSPRRIPEFELTTSIDSGRELTKTMSIDNVKPVKSYKLLKIILKLF